MNILLSSFVIIFVVLIGSILSTLQIADLTEAGWAIWHYPLVSLTPVVISLILSGILNHLLDEAAGLPISTRFRTKFALLVRFMVAACIFWIVIGEASFVQAIAFLPEIDREAEDLFYRGWLEFGNENFIGSALLVVSVSAICMRSSVRYWAPIALLTGVYGTWGLASSFKTLIAALMFS